MRRPDWNKRSMALEKIFPSPAPWRQGYHLTYTGFWPKQTPRLFWKDLQNQSSRFFFGGKKGPVEKETGNGVEFQWKPFLEDMADANWSGCSADVFG